MPAGEGEAAQRFEEVVVGELGIVQVGGGFRAPEEAPERGKSQVPAHALAVRLAREGAGDEPKLLPEVAVARPPDPARERPQTGRAVVRGVDLPRGPSIAGIVPGVEQ